MQQRKAVVQRRRWMRSRHEPGPVLSQDFDRSWANPMKSKKLALARTFEVAEDPEPGGLKGSGSGTPQ
jgi:hypothetical protein